MGNMLRLEFLGTRCLRCQLRTSISIVLHFAGGMIGFYLLRMKKTPVERTHSNRVLPFQSLNGEATAEAEGHGACHLS